MFQALWGLKVWALSSVNGGCRNGLQHMCSYCVLVCLRADRRPPGRPTWHDQGPVGSNSLMLGGKGRKFPFVQKLPLWLWQTHRHIQALAKKNNDSQLKPTNRHSGRMLNCLHTVETPISEKVQGVKFRETSRQTVYFCGFGLYSSKDLRIDKIFMGFYWMDCHEIWHQFP